MKISAATVIWVLLFLAACVVLDQLEYLGPTLALPISPRNLALGLCLSAVMRWQLWALPLVFVGSAIGEFLNHRWGVTGILWNSLIMTLETMAAIYGAQALSRLVPGPVLKNRIVAVLVASLPVVLILGAVKAYGLGRLDLLPAGTLEDSILHVWVGDAVGIVVVTPLTSFAFMPGRSRAIPLRQIPEMIVQGVLVLAMVWLAFGEHPDFASRYFYGIFLPMTWIVLRFGFRGAIAMNATIQFALIATLSLFGHEDVRVTLFHALLLVLAASSLTFGMTIDLNRAAAQRLRAREEEITAGLRVAVTGELAGTLAHELGHPLSAIANYAAGLTHMVRRFLPDDHEALQISTKLNQEVVRATDTLRRLGDFFRTGALVLERADMGVLVRDTVALLKDRLGNNAIDPRLSVQSGPNMVLADRIQLQAVIYNLLINAIDALRPVPAEARALVVTVRRAGDTISLDVEDSGGGVSPDVKMDIFEPLVTTKKHGLGLGLAMSRSVLKAHHGQITLGDSPLGGARFTVTLPLAE